MGEDKGQDFKLEAPCLFPLARPEQKMAEVWNEVLWIEKTDLDDVMKTNLVDVRRATEKCCKSSRDGDNNGRVKIGIQGLDIFIFDLLFFSIVVIVEAFLFVGLSGCFAHTSSSPGEAFSRIDCHQLQGRDLSPFVHIHQFLDNTSVVWVNQVQSLRTNLAESGNRSTDDKVLLVSEQGGEVFGDLRKTALRTMGLMSAVPFLIASETIWLMSGIRTPAIVFSAMARTRGLRSRILHLPLKGTDFNDTAQAFEDFPFVPAVQ
ncbi:hypothetical protein KCU99_g136, partial [Aureobasidium melanogenum]